MNYSSFIKLLCFIIISIIVWSCASTGRPSGGPKDTTPPSLVIEESSPNFSVNYSPQKIELVFDEWIELKNQSKEILISPPFFIKPKITQRGKKVTVEFPKEEPLREDATYTLNFGKSIVDFTEANAIEDFKFLFATGDKLDSLSFEGSIVDAYGGEPVKDVLVMLYDLLGDSVVVSEKPFYFARADDKGKFKFEYLKNDTFKLIVIEDLNLNYLLDDELERLAFIDSTFILNDSSKFTPELRLFTPKQSTRIINSNSKTPGLITTVFNKNADLVTYNFLYPDSFDPFVELKGDTIKFWYAEKLDSAGIIYGIDTLDFTTKPFDSIFYKKKIRLQGNNLNKSKLAPFDSLVLSFTAPIEKIDTSLISLSDKPKLIKIDSLNLKNDSLFVGNEVDSTNLKILDQDSLSLELNTVEIDSIVNDSLGIMDSLTNLIKDTIAYYPFDQSINVRELTIQNMWKEGHDYQLTLLPGAVIDIYGRISDTIVFDFKTSSRDEYGNIKLMVTDLDTTEQYIVLLRDDKKQVRESIITERSNEMINFERLPVSTYNVHLIKDENRDGKWTTGDYWLGIQPELLKKFDLEKLRENWDLEANVSWKGSGLDSLSNVIDSSFMQNDSITKPIEFDVKEKTKRPEKRKPDDNTNNKKGIRGKEK